MSMSVELDHFFILCEANAPQAELVAALGLTEGSSNKHPGQGTSNRRFFFENTALEFLFVHDAVEAANGPAKGLRFHDRSSNPNASSFGLIMRTCAPESEVPFKGWKYCPEYIADDQCFFVGSNSDILEEPLCIVMPENLPQRKSMPTPENPDWHLTALRISVPILQLSCPLLEISKCQIITVEANKPHCLELTFNEGAQGMRKNFASDMPLVINW